MNKLLMNDFVFNNLSYKFKRYSRKNQEHFGLYPGFIPSSREGISRMAHSPLPAVGSAFVSPGFLPTPMRKGVFSAGQRMIENPVVRSGFEDQSQHFFPLTDIRIHRHLQPGASIMA